MTSVLESANLESKRLFKESLVDRVKNDFTYHRPPVECLAVFVEIREAAKALALLIVEHVPSGREQSTALTQIEQAVMHANAGIARQFPVESIG